MAETQTLPVREDVPEELTWKLEDIFPTDQDWGEAFNELQKDISKMSDFQGKLGESATQLLNMFTLQDELSERLGKLYTYAHMRYDQDTTNDNYQAMNQKAESIITEASQHMSYIVPEILEIPEQTIQQFLKEEKGLTLYKQTLDEITRQKKHILSKEEEALLAKVSDPIRSASQTFGMLNNADLTFPVIENEKGEKIELTHGKYLGFMESPDRKVREKAFKAMYETYGQFKNTFASTLGGVLKKDNFYADVRHYDSARQAALDSDKIPESVYDHLIDAIHEKLPLLHRYIELRKKVLNVDELHMYDLYTPLVKDIDMTIPYEKAKEYVLKGLKPLGEDYSQVLEEAFNQRWIDVVENKGKRSGAYSSGAYGTNPYILLNWQDNLNDLFTLVHELGHSVHSYYTRKNQPFRYGDYSIFVAEVASTTNEALLNEYMIENAQTKEEKMYLLNHFLEGFRGTVFRQTMFAEFEHNIHERAQKGEALTAEVLSNLYYDLNQKYYGESMHSDEEIALEWARIPHFYYNYYVYQYATGYSAATTLANGILKKKPGAIHNYIDFLKAGSSDYPIEVLNKAGVDMTSKQPVLDALDVFEEKLTELENLFDA